MSASWRWRCSRASSSDRSASSARSCRAAVDASATAAADSASSIRLTSSDTSAAGLAPCGGSTQPHECTWHARGCARGCAGQQLPPHTGACLGTAGDNPLNPRWKPGLCSTTGEAAGIAHLQSLLQPLLHGPGSRQLSAGHRQPLLQLTQALLQRSRHTSDVTLAPVFMETAARSC